MPVIKRVLELVWSERGAPKDWQASHLTAVFKKGDRRLCANYRGISLLAIIGKIFSLIILRRICALLDAKCSETQTGFRKGRGTIDNISNLRQILERRAKWSQETLVSFLDYSAAFDSVDRESLWLLLKVAGVPERLTELIRHMYEDSVCMVKVSGQLSQPFEVSTGVRQGDVLSPLLFLQAVDWVMVKAAQDTDGVTAGMGIRVSHLEYADDVAALAESLGALQDQINRIQSRSGSLGLKLNPSKCEWIASHSVTGELLLNGVAMKRVPQFCYLGSVITPDGDASAEIANRIGKAKGVFKTMDTALWGRREIPASLKVRLFDSLILAILLYGVEATPLRVAETRSLASFESRCLRRIMGIHWSQGVSSEELLHRAGRVDGAGNILTMAKRVRQFRLRWLGHLSRMNDERLPKQIFYAPPIPPEGDRVWDTEVQKQWRRANGLETSTRRATNDLE